MLVNSFSIPLKNLLIFPFVRTCKVVIICQFLFVWGHLYLWTTASLGIGSLIDSFFPSSMWQSHPTTSFWPIGFMLRAGKWNMFVYVCMCIYVCVYVFGHLVHICMYVNYVHECVCVSVLLFCFLNNFLFVYNLWELVLLRFGIDFIELSQSWWPLKPIMVTMTFMYLYFSFFSILGPGSFLLLSFWACFFSL